MTHEQVLPNSVLRQGNRHVYELLRPWAIEQAVGYLYSTSLPLRRLLGDRQTTFEKAVTNTLLAIDPTGHFTELARPRWGYLVNGVSGGFHQ
jgi:hypothetical protein